MRNVAKQKRVDDVDVAEGYKGMKLEREIPLPLHRRVILVLELILLLVSILYSF